MFIIERLFKDKINYSKNKISYSKKNILKNVLEQKNILNNIFQT